jgi:hypothetical protein
MQPSYYAYIAKEFENGILLKKQLEDKFLVMVINVDNKDIDIESLWAKKE